MTTNRRASLWVSCLLVLAASAGFAQTDPAQQPSGPPPAHLSVVEGQAFIDRESRSDAAMVNLPLLDGDRLRTVDGRLEVILSDGSLLHLDRGTTVDVLATDLLRLLQGRVFVIVRGARDPQQAVRYQIDAPVASVQTGGPGEFRVWAAETARGREVELAVFRGQATLASNNGAEDLRAGERSLVRDGLAPSSPQYFNSARWDDFDRWSAARRVELLGAASAQYLPSELAVYASTFDQYGTWRSDPEEGAVWYPTVADDWRPYSVGYWHTYPAWGSFWIGGDPWGWPTHHYGHWGFSFSFGWYWRPATVWGPAWVSWAYSPGYVSWCPLGRYGYPVFGHFGVRGHYYGNHIDPWRGWTVVPRQHYGTRTPMHRIAVDGNRLDPAARGAFAPGRPDTGPNRAAARANAGGLAVPRNPPGGGASARRGSLGGGAPRGGQPATPAGLNATSVPRAGGSSPLPGGRARLSPDEAARVLAGNGARAAGTSTRRTLPAPPAYGSAGQRTDEPAATPDVTAFGSRRNQSPAVPRESTRTGAPAQFGSGEPTRFGNGAPSQFGSGAPAQFGGARARTYPRANPPSEPAGTGEWSPPPAVRQHPYIRGSGQSAGTVDGRAYPPSAERPAQPAPRDNPYRGGGGITGPSSPRDNPYTRGNGGGMSAPSARPRDGGGGMPAGPSVRRGGSGASGGSSAAPAAPRYNPGSGASQPRSGGSSPPPPRRRGGTPD